MHGDDTQTSGGSPTITDKVTIPMDIIKSLQLRNRNQESG